MCPCGWIRHGFDSNKWQCRFWLARFHGFDAFIKDLYQQGLAIGYQMAICDRATHPELPVAVELDANQKAQLHDAVQRHMSKMGKIFEAACRGTLTEKRLFFKGVSDALNQGVFDDKGRPIGATSRYDVLHLLHENYGDVLKCQNIIQLTLGFGGSWIRSMCNLLVARCSRSCVRRSD